MYKYLSLFLVIITLSFFKNAFAFESLINNPGSRAMAMAGVFSAQADDASAIWYNPAATAKVEDIFFDSTLEWGDIPSQDISQVNNNLVSSDSQDKLQKVKYLAAYSNGTFTSGAGRKLSAGIALIDLYRLTFDTNIPSNPVDFRPFGKTSALYTQISLLLSAKLNKTLSIGGTFDVVKADIKCHAFQPCVGDGPLGYGYTLGFIDEIFTKSDLKLAWGGVWRSKADLKYRSKSDSSYSLGAAIEEVIPGRPQVFTIGVHLQMPTRSFLLNTNAILEKRFWSNIKDSYHILSDYKKYGFSNELIFVLNQTLTASLRMGLTQDTPQEHDIASKIDVLSFGAGLGFSHKSFLDIAFESRKSDSGSDRSVTLLSLSYSYQLQ